MNINQNMLRRFGIIFLFMFRPYHLYKERNNNCVVSCVTLRLLVAFSGKDRVFLFVLTHGRLLLILTLYTSFLQIFIL